MNRYTQAALFLGEEWVMPSALHIVAVTRPLPEGDCGEQQCGELLLQKDPPWGTTIPAPASWGAEVCFCPFLVTKFYGAGVPNKNS